MPSKIEIEENQFRLLSLEFASQITTATNLARLKKWAKWVLPLRSTILCVNLKLAEGNARISWMQTEQKIYELGEPSVHILSKMHRAESNKDKLLAMIRSENSESPWRMAVELGASYLALIAIAGAIAWQQL